MKHPTRRTFAKTTSIAIGGMICGVPERVFSGAASDQAASTAAVLEMVSGYAGKATLCGAGVASHRTGTNSPLTRIIAEVSDRAAYQRFYQRPVKGRLTVQGNEFSLENGGHFYSVKNLSPEAYESELRSLRRGMGRFFSHETLTAESPVSASAPGSTYTIKPLRHDTLNEANPGSGFASWFDALIAAEARGFEISAGATQCGATVCATTPSTVGAAEQAVDDVIERIACAAEVLEPQALRALLARRFVDESFLAATGRSSAGISRDHQSARGKLGGHSESSVWLALAVGSTDNGGMIHRALTSTNAVYAGSTRAALAGTMEILRSGSLSNLGLTATPGQGAAAAETPWQASLLATAGDLDGDGVPSLVEYALGTDPLDPASKPEPRLATETDGGARYVTLTYQKDTTLTDVRYIPQTANELGRNDWSATGVEDRAISSSNGVELRRARIPMTGGRQFLRVLIEAK